MIILTAGHTGPNSGAQCTATHFDEGAENIWLRNRIAEILTNDYGLVVLMDDDRASLKLLTQALTEDLSLTELTENTEDAVASPAILSPTDNSDDSDFNSSFSSIRSLAAQEVALQICTDCGLAVLVGFCPFRVIGRSSRVSLHWDSLCSFGRSSRASLQGSALMD